MPPGRAAFFLSSGQKAPETREFRGFERGLGKSALGEPGPKERRQKAAQRAAFWKSWR